MTARQACQWKGSLAYEGVMKHHLTTALRSWAKPNQTNKQQQQQQRQQQHQQKPNNNNNDCFSAVLNVSRPFYFHFYTKQIKNNIS